MKKYLTIAIILIIYTSALVSQDKTDANVIGHVVCNGNHIPFATVSVKGTTIGTNTDETGHYQLINLPVGTYVVRAQAIGYKPQEKEVITEKGETSEVNFSLEEDLFGLEEIVVTADRSEIKRVESVTIVNTISPKIFSSVQAVSLSEGLTFSPGIRIENNCQNCGFSQIRMNGMEGPYSQILINSRPVFSGLAGVYGLELIPSNMIERVEVVRGGGSALYGSNAIAGTINIILREPVTSCYEAGVNGGITGVGTDGSGDAAPDYSFNLNASVTSDDDRTGMALYGFTRKREMFDANDDGYSEISLLSNQTIGTRIFHRFGTRGKMTMDFFNIKEEREGGNREEYIFHERDISESLKHDIKTGAVTYEQYFRDYDLLSLFFSSQHLDRDSYYGAERSLKDYGRSEDLTFNTGVQYKTVIGNNTVMAGVESTGGFLTDKKLGYPDYEEAEIVNDSIVNVPHTDNILIADQQSLTTGAFIQYDLRLGNLRIGLGGRFDHYSITDNTGDNERKEGNVLSPRISLMYKVIPTLQARISYSQGYRAPQIFDEDLHIETSGSRKVIHENDPDLKQETSHSFTASLDFNRTAGNVTTGLLLEGFYTRLKDPFVNEIGVPDEEGKVVYTRMNAENGAVVKGINIEYKIKPLRTLLFSSGFTIQSSRYDVEQEFSTRKFFRTPSNYGYFNLDWECGESFSCSATGTYTGKMMVPYFGPLSDPGTGELHESESFLDMGCKIQYSVKMNGATIQIYTGVKNMFNSFQKDQDTGIDRDPAYIYGPVSPRSIYLGIRIGNKL